MSDSESTDICALCLDISDTSPYFRWIILPCRHRFHVTCFWQFINSSESTVRSKCPLCQTTLSWIEFSNPARPQFNCIVLTSSTTRSYLVGADWWTDAVCRADRTDSSEPSCVLTSHLRETSSVPTIAIHPAYLWTLLASHGWLETRHLLHSHACNHSLILPSWRQFFDLTEIALLERTCFLKPYRLRLDRAILTNWRAFVGWRLVSMTKSGAIRPSQPAAIPWHLFRRLLMEFLAIATLVVILGVDRSGDGRLVIQDRLRSELATLHRLEPSDLSMRDILEGFVNRVMQKVEQHAEIGVLDLRGHSGPIV